MIEKMHEDADSFLDALNNANAPVAANEPHRLVLGFIDKEWRVSRIDYADVWHKIKLKHVKGRSDLAQVMRDKLGKDEG